MSNLQLANNLQYLRNKKCLTQKELSQLLNISRQAYSNYETSKRTPDLDSLLRLAELFDVSLDALVLCNIKSKDEAPSSSSNLFSEERTPYTLSVNKKTGKSIYVTEEELDILSKIRTLSASNKQIITGFINDNTK